MFKKVCLITASLFLILLISGCSKEKTSITMAGSTAFQPFAERLAELYMKAHPEVVIIVQGGGSAVGIQSANSGVAQIGMADLLTLPKEAQGLTSTVVAQDGIAIIVNPQNGLTNLTVEQVRDIFNGKISNWKDVGGNDASINVVSREAGSGTRTSFEGIIKDINLKKDALILDSNGTVRESVANDPNAVGYLSHGLITNKIKPVNLDGQECTTEAINSGKYILVRPIFLLVKGELTGNVKLFIDYILSAEGQDLIKSKGLLPAKSSPGK